MELKEDMYRDHRDIDKKYKRITLLSLYIITFAILSACGSSNNSASFAPIAPEPPDYTRNSTATYSFDCSNISSIDLNNITDDYYANQFHLKQMKVKTAWQNQFDRDKCFGNGVTITVVDNGVERQHEDLIDNIDSKGSYDFISQRKGHLPIPNSKSFPNHGTNVAGIIAAAANGFGVIGIANKSKIQSYNLIAFEGRTDVDVIIAMQASGHISNNSWGPSDRFPKLLASPVLWRRVIDNQVKNGRNGKGTIYVWAAGNGGRMCDPFPPPPRRPLLINCNNNSNYDGYTNYRKVIAVAALNGESRAIFSEKGANILISAPGVDIYTTKLTPGANEPFYCSGIDCRYTKEFSGTSAAAPMVSGAIALLLENNPDLGWRDVRKIIAQSATKTDADDSDWVQNGAGLWVNHQYGYGLIDVEKSIDLAQNWTNLGTEKSYQTSQQFTTNNDIDSKQKSTFTLTIPTDVGISQLESVEIIIDTSHSYWADLTIELVSPQGTTSVLAETHICNAQCSIKKGQTLKNWVFSSSRLIGENPRGEWQILIQDLFPEEDTGKVDKITLNLYGT